MEEAITARRNAKREVIEAGYIKRVRGQAKVNGSPPLSLGKADGVKLGKSILLAASGALFSALAVYLGDLDKSSYAWLVPLITVGLNAFRKFVMDTLQP